MSLSRETVATEQVERLQDSLSNGRRHETSTCCCTDCSRERRLIREALAAAEARGRAEALTLLREMDSAWRGSMGADGCLNMDGAFNVLGVGNQDPASRDARVHRFYEVLGKIRVAVHTADALAAAAPETANPLDEPLTDEEREALQTVVLCSKPDPDRLLADPRTLKALAQAALAARRYILSKRTA